MQVFPLSFICYSQWELWPIHAVYTYSMECFHLLMYSFTVCYYLCDSRMHRDSKKRVEVGMQLAENWVYCLKIYIYVSHCIHTPLHTSMHVWHRIWKEWQPACSWPRCLMVACPYIFCWCNDPISAWDSFNFILFYTSIDALKSQNHPPTANTMSFQ